MYCVMRASVPSVPSVYRRYDTDVMNQSQLCPTRHDNIILLCGEVSSFKGLVSRQMSI